MSAPKWLNSVLHDFGAGINLQNFGFNSADAAAIRFETGVSLRFEYAFESLLVTMQIPAAMQSETMKALLKYSQPERRPSFLLRVAYLEKSESAIMVARIPERNANLAALNSVFNELWVLAEDFRRRLA
ncbi:MAG: hypothetical protein IJS15_07700 [Victivallales bacterium]|nr:hypothetical protein [Victivallales bacterium]